MPGQPLAEVSVPRIVLEALVDAVLLVDVEDRTPGQQVAFEVANRRLGNYTSVSR